MAEMQIGKVRGLSAYEIAVQKGYKGTEEEWIAYLKAIDGTRATLNDGPLTNVNFKERKVVQDGLVYEAKNTNTTKIIDNITDFVIQAKVKFGSNPDGSTLGIITYSNDKYKFLLGRGVLNYKTLVLTCYPLDGTTKVYGAMSTKLFENDVLYDLKMRQKNETELEVFVNNELVLFNGLAESAASSLTLPNKLGIATRGSGHRFNGVFNSIIAYNRKLTTQEIQHNFSVLNNPTSISSIETTDSSSVKTSFLIGTKTDLIETRTGHTEEERYTALLSKFGKKFTSDGSDINVANGIENQRVLGAVIKGQTVKCVAERNSKTTLIKAVTFTSSLTTKASDTNDKIYTYIFYVSRMVGTPKVQLAQSNDAGSTTSVVDTKLGINIKTFTSNISNIGKIGLNSSSSTDAEIDIDYVSVVEGTVLLNGYIPFGLNSTQATLSNNGLKYSFYEPTIQGKTRVMKAAKGTQNWAEISDSETRNTTTYDYKLESNNDLGSVPSAYDYIDRARKVKIINTKDVVLNGSDSWLQNESVMVTGTNTIGFYLPITGYVGTEIVANSFNIMTNSNMYNGDVEGINFYTNSSIRIRINKSKLTTKDLAGFKTWLQSNPTTVRYQLSTPTEIPMTDEEIKQYDAYKKLIEVGGVSGVYDTFEINKDGSGVLKQNTKSKSVSKNDNIAAETSATGVFEDSSRFKVLIGDDYKISTPFEIQGSAYVQSAFSTNVEGAYYYSSGNNFGIRILNSKLTTLDVAGFKAWLEANPITIRYQLATPIVTYIPKELVPAILTQATNIISSDSAVKPSGIEVTVATTDDISKSYPVTLLNAYTQTPSTAAPVVNLLNSGLVRLQMDLTAPATDMKTTLFALDQELRPVTSAKIPVFVNGVCQLATVDKTTGNVNLVSTPAASANVYIKTDYRKDI